MSKLQELINRLCPNGVEFKPLGELGNFFGGLTGKSKEDFKDGNAKFITYMNIYSNPSLNINIQDFVKVTENEKQNRIIKGDILFTGSSETPNECGFTSVVTSEVSEPIYLNSFCFGLRLNNPNLFNLDFLKHLLRSDELRSQISKTASGVTRFNVSKARLAKVLLPVPPIEVQIKIAEILDRFADYSAELQARKEQYEYYRNLLLTFNPSASGCGTDDEQEDSVTTWGGHSYPIIWKTMGEICTNICSGGTPLTSNKSYYNGTIPWMRTQEVDWKNVYDTEIKISEEALTNSSAKLIPENCVIVAMYGATAAKCCINKIPLTTNQACCNLEVDQNIAHYKYVYHWICKEYLKLKSMGEGSQSNINSAKIKNYSIPIPPIELQEKIVAILDRFEALVNDLSQGLPAEIAAVKEQYEYYRNKLLTFKKAS